MYRNLLANCFVLPISEEKLDSHVHFDLKNS